MRRYRVEVDGRSHVVDVNEQSQHQFKVSVGGQEFSVTLSAAEDVPETIISPDMADVSGEERTCAPPSAAAFKPASSDSLPKLVPAAPPPLATSTVRSVRGSLSAPMPGTITAVDVRAGDRVTTGQVLLKLEAMKMINAIKSPRDGVIASIAVQTGQSVIYGQVLVAFQEN